MNVLDDGLDEEEGEEDDENYPQGISQTLLNRYTNNATANPAQTSNQELLLLYLHDIRGTSNPVYEYQYTSNNPQLVSNTEVSNFERREEKVRVSQRRLSGMKFMGELNTSYNVVQIQPRSAQHHSKLVF